MICQSPDCNAPTRVLDSRRINAGAFVRRRRACRNGHRFSTYEASAGAVFRNRADALERLVAVLRDARAAAAAGRWLDSDDERLLAAALGVEA